MQIVHIHDKDFSFCLCDFYEFYSEVLIAEYIQIESEMIKHHSSWEKYKPKLQWGITSYHSEWPSSKNLQTTTAGVSVEGREPSCTIDGKVNWFSQYGEQYGDSLKKSRNKSIIQPINPTTGHIPWGNPMKKP